MSVMVCCCIGCIPYNSSSSLMTSDDKRPKFGNRQLDDQSDVYEHNAWDNVPWDEQLRAEVVNRIEVNASMKMSDQQADELETNAATYWDCFYDKHENKFFKDRHWLFTEFPELLPCESRDNESDSISQPKKPMKTIFELGCGCGNTVFPLLKLDKTGTLFIYCCDYSEKAIQIVTSHPEYDPLHCHAFTHNLTSPWISMPFGTGTLDIATMIFVLSAIDPFYHKHVIENIKHYLKPGGLLLFRDYGYCDLTQVRFKSGRCIKNNFYVRGDGTRAYFFTEQELDELFTGCGFIKIDLHVDRRLQVNRANKKKMYRVWIQAKYQNSVTS